MTEQEMQLLTIDSFEDFEAGNSNSGFHLEEGSYDGAAVVGYQVVAAEFEGKKKTQVKLLWQLADAEGTVHTLRGSGWTISANEKAKMRIELMKWFDTTEWPKVCEILVKGKILVKHEDGKAHFDMSGFIGKRGKLLIAEKTSKKGSKYPVIMSISKTKNKGAFEFGEVPWFLTEGDDILYVKLADGVKIRPKEEEDTDGLVEPVQAVGVAAVPQYAQSVLPQYPNQAAPAVPPNANVSVNANPAGFMQPNMVSDPAPAPAPQQTGNPGADDGDDDLPFN